MVSLSLTDYESLLNSSGTSSTDAACTGAGVFVLSHGKSWMLDSGVIAHITDTKSPIHTFSSSCLPPVRLADGTFLL